jgi:pectinesterase
MRMRAVLGAVVVLAAAAGARAEEAKELVVAADGSGQFRTVQDAVDAAPEGATSPVIIRLKPGRHEGRVNVPVKKTFLTIRGEDPATTVITFSLGAPDKKPDGTNVGTSGSAIVVPGGNDFTAENVTFENSFGNRGQAVAMRTTGDRLTFRNCRFLGWQDTLYPNGGRCYFDRCYIEGGVDFIFGRAPAVFDHCEIKSKVGGYITAASTEPTSPFGLVFLDCKLTAADDVKAGAVYLGRPWRPNGATAFVRCAMGPHIAAEGWKHWNDTQNPETARYAEFGSTGPGGDMTRRADWAKKLTEQEAAGYTVEKVLAGTDGWNPAKGGTGTGPNTQN